MAWNDLTAGMVDVDSPITTTLMDYIKGNFDFIYALFDETTGHDHAAAAQWDGAAVNVPAGSITQTEIDSAAVGQGECKTSTGTTSGSLAAVTGVDIAMNAYCFWPNIFGQSSNNIWLMGHETDGGSADAPRFRLYNSNAGSSRNYVVDWRYITA